MPVTLAQWSAHKRRQQNPLWPSAQIFWNDCSIFVLGCAGVYSVDLVGSLPGNEIVALILLPFLLFSRGKRAFRREYLWFYILLAGWLFGTIGGDLYLGVSVSDKLKGIARIVFLGIDFATLAILVNKKTRGMVVFALSITVVMIASARVYSGDSYTAWKFGGSYAVTTFVLLISSYFYAIRKYWVCILLFLGLSALNLIFAFRSQVADDLIAAALTAPILTSSTARLSRHSNKVREITKLVFVFGLAAGGIFAADRAVNYAVNKNWFNENIEAKFQAQSAGKLGVLVGGRPETLVAIRAIIDSPIIGHGSFAQDMKYVQMMQDIQYEFNYTDSDEPDESLGLAIPTHSHLTQAWVESGILGGIFWIWVIALSCRAVLRLLFYRLDLAPLYAFFLISFAWDILYSRWGASIGSGEPISY